MCKNYEWNREILRRFATVKEPSQLLGQSQSIIAVVIDIC